MYKDRFCSHDRGLYNVRQVEHRAVQRFCSIQSSSSTVFCPKLLKALVFLAGALLLLCEETMRSGRDEPDPIDPVIPFHQLFFLLELDPSLGVELLVVSIRPSGGFGESVVVDGLDSTCESIVPGERIGIVMGEVSSMSPPG